jgi:hypothetical protein
VIKFKRLRTTGFGGHSPLAMTVGRTLQLNRVVINYLSLGSDLFVIVLFQTFKRLLFLASFKTPFIL